MGQVYAFEFKVAKDVMSSTVVEWWGSFLKNSVGTRVDTTRTHNQLKSFLLPMSHNDPGVHMFTHTEQFQIHAAF